MTLAQIAAIADLLAALGVIASLVFLAWEIRKNGEQARLSNWHATLSALREQKRRTDDLAVADVIERGRRDYDSLTGAEKIVFGYWMEEWLQAQEGLLVFRGVSAHGREELLSVVKSNFAAMFEYQGCRAWWEDSGLATRWPMSLVGIVTEAIETQQRRA